MTRPRIAVAGFQHETNSFAPHPTGWAQFRHPGDFPDLQRGPAMREALRGIALPMAGILPALEAAGAEIVPLAWAVSNPGGPVTAEAFERIAALILAALSDAGPLDAVVLELHGAMMAEGFPDAEGELLRRLRAVVGPETWFEAARLRAPSSRMPSYFRASHRAASHDSKSAAFSSLRTSRLRTTTSVTLPIVETRPGGQLGTVEGSFGHTDRFSSRMKRPLSRRKMPSKCAFRPFSDMMVTVRSKIALRRVR